MSPWIRRCLLALLAPPLLAAGALALALDRQPAVPEAGEVALADVQHALAVARSHDPRYAEPGRLMHVSVTERDVELLLNHAAHRMLDVRVRLQLEAGEAQLVASRPWAWHGLQGWLNVQTRWQQTDGLPTLQAWRLGSLPLPVALAPRLVRTLGERSGLPGLDLLPEVLRTVRFGHDELTLAYVWQGQSTKERALAVLTPPADQQRLRAYSDLLVQLTASTGAGRPGQGPLTLAQLIGPMFELARQRSLHDDAAKENRAAVLTMALYVSGRGLWEVVPGAQAWPQPQRLPVLLNGRDDFPQHFLLSALLAMEGTTPLTNAIGLSKEIEDAHGGSGFSFNDLAANRAGMRFGQQALQQPTRLQLQLAGGVAEKSLMPDVADLPEFLSAAEFKRRYERVGSPGYQRLLADIEQRVDRLALYR